MIPVSNIDEEFDFLGPGGPQNGQKRPKPQKICHRTDVPPSRRRGAGGAGAVTWNSGGGTKGGGGAFMSGGGGTTFSGGGGTAASVSSAAGFEAARSVGRAAGGKTAQNAQIAPQSRRAWRPAPRARGVCFSSSTRFRLLRGVWWARL